MMNQVTKRVQAMKLKMIYLQVWRKKLIQRKKDSDEKEGEESNENKEANELNAEENKDKEKDDLVDDNEKSKKEIEDQKENDDSNNDEKKGEQQDNNIEEIDGVKPRPLHKVTSIFLRNLSPTITKQEVEAMCRRYPGFLRAAIADPSPERRWFRRGWVTFERNTKIKEICFNLNNIRLRECELGPIVNRDLQRRIRSVNGITVDKKVVRNDIKIAAKVITNLDKRWSLWEAPKTAAAESAAAAEGGDSKPQEKDEKVDKNDDNASLGLSSNNPILANITD